MATTELDTVGDDRRTCFSYFPTRTPLQFLVSIMYSNLFQTLPLCGQIGSTEASIPVHCIMDKPDVALPDDFDKILATSAFRGISPCHIIQNSAQIEALLKTRMKV